MSDFKVSYSSLQTVLSQAVLRGFHNAILPIAEEPANFQTAANTAGVAL
jgi:hypothetical protein